MTMIRQLRSEMSSNPRWLVFLTILSACSTTLILAVINIAAAQAQSGGAGIRLVLLFLVTTALYAATQKAVTGICATEVEGLVDRLRGDVVEGIRHSDMQSLDEIGQAKAFSALTRDCQTVSRCVPMLAVGAQDAVTLLFVALYVAWLSLAAFGAVTLFLVLAVMLHWRRMADLRQETSRAEAAEMELFDGLGGMLRGQKEIRLNEQRGLEVVGDLAEISRRTRMAKTAIKQRWSREFAGIQLAFYVLVGVMVFVVPMVTTTFHTEAIQATTAAMFMIGPIGTVVQAVPIIGDAEHALTGLYALKERLRGGRAAEAESTTTAPMAPPQEIVLSDLGYRYPDDKGESGFSVGPLNARFRAGEITFITGGNGSGKSTFLRLLVGLVPASGGTLSVDGEIVTEARMQAYRDTISAVFSDYHLFRPLYGIAPEAWPNAGPLLEKLGLDRKVRVEDGRFSTLALSAGQRKRLALVVAELEDKPVLILDEWAADQDPHFRHLFYEEILPAYRAQGKMVICVTHDDRWFGVADRVLAMREGAFVEGTG
ncbi:cyclic peptide export ABC transporter [Magnetospirillum fulvum]|uniref:Putative ATP-binding cassette transporter n=1 Tax=Magnetospirillum fulvum TaxID=1082 RepID=A0A1H6HPS6_MAGFU|nr:cyclic peptide export ABC transporter [Magnetospirillum fulvum]SEH37903.1 putative ATP-binding cassette transporter [Magnetospirillum fulvum]